MVLKIEESSVAYGNGTRVATYLKDEIEHRKVAPVDEFLIAEAANINERNPQEISFSEVESAIQLLTMHLSNSSQRVGNIFIDIQSREDESVRTISSFNLRPSQFPYPFPVLPLKQNTTIVIRSDYLINLLTIVAKQVSIVHYQQAEVRNLNEQLRR